jgi:uncharacterized protein (DUF4415 family)
VRKEYDFSQAKRGAVIPSPGKTRITIMLDDDLIEYFRAKAETQGAGYQTLINASLRATVWQQQNQAADDKPLTIAVLREILREELHQ